jgi:hypothetical protein
LHPNVIAGKHAHAMITRRRVGHPRCALQRPPMIVYASASRCLVQPLLPASSSGLVRFADDRLWEVGQRQGQGRVRVVLQGCSSRYRVAQVLAVMVSWMPHARIPPPAAPPEIVVVAGHLQLLTSMSYCDRPCQVGDRPRHGRALRLHSEPARLHICRLLCLRVFGDPSARRR